MQSFADNAGRVWTVRLNVDVLRRVRALCKVNLMDAASGDLADRLAADPVLLCDVLYAVCKAEAFAEALGGDAIDEATAALLEELVDFFPKRRREVLRRAMAKRADLQERAAGAAIELIESGILEERVETAIGEVFRTAGSSDSPTGSPEASA
jgi:hypothetical protein